jgi:hypothetical protein
MKKKEEGPKTRVVKSMIDEKDEPKTPAEQLKSEIKDADKGEAKMKKAMSVGIDGITEYLKAFKKVGELAFLEDFTDNRIPHLENGSLLRVARFYPALKLVIDRVGKEITLAEIDAKKWEFERCGYTYTWIVDGEQLDLDPDEEKNVLWDRAEKLVKDPEVRLKFRVSQIIGPPGTTM